MGPSRGLTRPKPTDIITTSANIRVTLALDTSSATITIAATKQESLRSYKYRVLPLTLYYIEDKLIPGVRTYEYEPDMIAREMLAFSSKSPENQKDSNLMIAIA